MHQKSENTPVKSASAADQPEQRSPNSQSKITDNRPTFQLENAISNWASAHPRTKTSMAASLDNKSSHPFPLQLKPVKDEKFEDFYKDDQEERLKLKLIESEPVELKFTGVSGDELGNNTAKFLLKDQLTPLFWKRETINDYYTDEGKSEKFDVKKYINYHQFGSWVETFSEVRAEQEKIDQRALPLEEAARLKNALSMYLFQQGVNNAFFSAKEIDRFAFQASPLIYRTENQYLRSFATSYVKALQQKLPKKLRKGTFMPARSADMNTALGQFFAVLELKDVAVVANIKLELETGIAKTIEQAVAYLYTDQAKLESYWETPGNPQAFIDLTKTLEKKAVKYEDVEKVGAKVKEAFQQAVVEKLVDHNQLKDPEKPANPEALKKHLLNRLGKPNEVKTGKAEEEKYATKLKSGMEGRINATHARLMGEVHDKYKKKDLDKVHTYIEQLDASKEHIVELKGLGVDGIESKKILVLLTAIQAFKDKLDLLDEKTFDKIGEKHPKTSSNGVIDRAYIAIAFKRANSVAKKIKNADGLAEDLMAIQWKISRINTIPVQLNILSQFKGKRLGNIDSKIVDLAKILGNGILVRNEKMPTGAFRIKCKDLFKNIPHLPLLKNLVENPNLSKGSQRAADLMSFKPVAEMADNTAVTEKNMTNIEATVNSFNDIDRLDDILSNKNLFKKVLDGKISSLNIKDFNQIFTTPIYQGLVSKSTDKYEKAFAKLLPKVLELIGNSGYVLTTGRVLEEETETGKKTKVRGVQIADSQMEMGVKSAINKTGNVPSPTEALKKFFEIGTPLRKITENILESQLAKMPKKDKEGRLSTADKSDQEYVEKLKIAIASRDNDKSLFTSDEKEALAAARKAFTTFEQAKNEVHTKIESDSIVNLIKGSGALDEGRSKLPVFALKQLEQHLEDALSSRAKMEEYARHLQFIHEIVILQLNLGQKDEILDKAGKKADYETFDFHVPKFDSGAIGAAKDDFLQSVHLADYGLKAFSQAYNAVAEQAIANSRDKLNVDAFYNIYFELNDKFRATEKTSKEKVKLTSPSDVKNYLQSDSVTNIENIAHRPDVILIDIHPNDATKEVIETNDVSHLITEVFKAAAAKKVVDYRLTVIIDITLNHTSDPTVGEIREKAQKYISDGNLNLVFVQSLTKFSQLGIDKQSGGIIFAYNKKDDWEVFNKSLAKAKGADPMDDSIQRYFYALFEYAKDEQVQYISRIRKNTQHLQHKITSGFSKLNIKENAITIGTNTDKGTCYVSIRYDEFIASLQSDKSVMAGLGASLGAVKPKAKAGTRERNAEIEKQVGYEKMHEFNVDVLEKGILGLMAKVGLPVAYRMSFGFPLSNVGETGKEVRFTIGIEQEELLDNYADVLSYLNGKLANQAASDKTILSDPKKRSVFLDQLIDGVDSLKDLQAKLVGLQKK